MGRIDRKRDNSHDRKRLRDVKAKERKMRRSSDDSDSSERERGRERYRDHDRKPVIFAQEKAERQHRRSSDDRNKSEHDRYREKDRDHNRRTVRHGRENECRSLGSDGNQYRDRNRDHNTRPVKHIQEKQRRESDGDRYRKRNKDHDKRPVKYIHKKQRRRRQSSEDGSETEGGYYRERNTRPNRRSSKNTPEKEERRSIKDRSVSKHGRCRESNRDNDRRPTKYAQQRYDSERSRSERNSSSSSSERAQSPAPRRMQFKRKRSESRDAERIPKRDFFYDRTTKDWKSIDREIPYEREKAEMSFREREMMYHKNLCIWEDREHRKMNEYEKEKVRMEVQNREDSGRTRMLKEFLENYNDFQDDDKYYKGYALNKKLEERLKEVEEDKLDRQREEEELKEGDKEQVRPRAKAQDENFLKEKSTTITQVSERHDSVQKEKQKTSPPSEMKLAINVAPPQEVIVSKQECLENKKNPLDIAVTPQKKIASAQSSTCKLSSSHITNNAACKRKATTDGTCSTTDNTESIHKKKRKVVPSDDAREQHAQIVPTSQMTAEEKKRLAYDLIDKIPFHKDGLFSYSVDWTLVNDDLMAKRIRPYIKNKIVDYVGEEMPPLTDYLCSKIISGCGPYSILGDLRFILDEEADIFLMKIWRLLVYEVEARKLGIENTSQRKT